MILTPNHPIPLESFLLFFVDIPRYFCCPLQLSEILKFGVDKLLSSEESSVQEVKLEKILGASRDGRWLDGEEKSSSFREDEEDDSESEEQSTFESFPLVFPFRVHTLIRADSPYHCPVSDHMYFFEGKDYSKDPSSEDHTTFDRLLEEQLAEFQKAAGEGRALRNKGDVRTSEHQTSSPWMSKLRVCLASLE